MNILYPAYGAAGLLAVPFLRLMLKRRIAAGKEIPTRLNERFGAAGLPRPPGRLIWIHAASVGETMSVFSVIEALAGAAQILLTTGTVTSATLAAERLPADARHQFVPLDIAGWVNRFLDHWRPDCAVFVESEIWPTLLRLTDARGIPRLLINASMSDRSTAKWRKISRFADTLIFGFRWVHVQSAADAANFRSLGAAGILEWGNLKYAAAPLPFDEAAFAALRDQITGPVWLAASTHPGEETVILAAHAQLAAAFPDLVTIIAPRHPTRGAAFALPRRSLGQLPVPGQPYIADTLGELGLFYRFAPFAFIGGSLADSIGGHNIAEAARLGIPIITGPHTAGITEQISALRATASLAEVTDATSLAAAAGAWLRDPALAAAAGARAATAFAGLTELPQKLARLILDTAL
jgi:3-deoxy-D-manno-octulosonic-acid transferase